MSNQDIQRMLQECLQGFDAGLTPEECLSAYPQAREELEPLFRQALSLRIAYTTSPSEAFRERTREKLMFAAGREVSQLFNAEPDSEFVDQTRSRLLNRAGAGAQEALRDVPPPRLPFWSNTRRHLLEAAAAKPSRPTGQALAFGLRSALSAAVVVFAIAIAGAAFFISSNPANETRFAISAELDEIERQVDDFETRLHRSEIIPPGMLNEIHQLAERTSTLYEHVGDEGDALEKLINLIDRQQDFIAYAQSAGHDHPDLISAREQLSETEEKIGVTTALVESPEPIETADTSAAEIPTVAVETATPEPEPEPTEEPAPTATATTEPADPIDPADLRPDEALVLLDPSDTTLGMQWLRVWAANTTFVIAGDWVVNLQLNESGIGTLLSDYLVITLPAPADENSPAVGPVVVDVSTGEVVALIDGDQSTLRNADGSIIDPAVLVDLTGDIGPALFHFLTSLQIDAPEVPDEDLEDGDEDAEEADALEFETTE